MTAIITIEVDKKYYEMNYTQIYRLKGTGKTEDEILSKLYNNRLRPSGKVIKIEFFDD